METEDQCNRLPLLLFALVPLEYVNTVTHCSPKSINSLWQACSKQTDAKDYLSISTISVVIRHFLIHPSVHSLNPERIGLQKSLTCISPLHLPNMCRHRAPILLVHPPGCFSGWSFIPSPSQHFTLSIYSINVQSNSFDRDVIYSRLITHASANLTDLVDCFNSTLRALPNENAPLKCKSLRLKPANQWFTPALNLIHLISNECGPDVILLKTVEL